MKALAEETTEETPEPEAKPEPKPEPKKNVLTPTTLGGLPILGPEDMEWINFLVYAEPKVGKTRLVASAVDVEDCAPVLLIDTEQGSMSAKPYSGLQVVQIATYQDLLKVLKSLRELVAAELNGGPQFPYGTVIIDTMSELQRLAMDHILKKGMEKAAELDRIKDPDVPEIADHGRVLKQMHAVTRGFKNLPCHFLATSHAQVDTSRPTHPKAKPMFTGKFADEIAGQFDIVLYLYKKEVDGVQKRIILTEATDTTVAGDRTETLPTIMIEPTFPELFTYIKKEKSK